MLACVCVCSYACVFVCMWVHTCWIAEVALQCSLGAVYLVFWEQVSWLKLCLYLAPQHEDCKCVPLSLAFLWVPELGLRSLPCKASTLLTELSPWTSFYLCIPSGSAVSGESWHSDLFNEWLWYCQLFTWIEMMNMTPSHLTKWILSVTTEESVKGKIRSCVCVCLYDWTYKK